jgi:hypothetical protein
VLTTLLLGSVAANLMGLALRHESVLLAPPGRANRNQVSGRSPEHADTAHHVVRQ